MIRDAVSSAHRVVVKVGSSFLTSNGQGIDPAAIATIVDAVCALRDLGKEVVLVSSGAIAAGLSPLALANRPKDLATQQASAAVGQGLLMHRYSELFASHSVVSGQILLTVDDLIRRGHYTNAQRTFFRLLSMGVVPIVNENDSIATSEIRFGDNDRLAALVAHLVQADALVLLSDVDGLFSAPPSQAEAKLIPEVTDFSAVADLAGATTSSVGTGGMVTKIEAARIATAAGIPTVLAHARNARAAALGEDVGTFFHPSTRRTPSRLLWLAHASAPKGQIHIDAGAVSAIVDRRMSLLAAGITDVTGEFDESDVIDVCAPSGKVIARGISAFHSDDVLKMRGTSTDQLAQTLGPEFDRAVVHRNDLIVAVE